MRHVDTLSRVTCLIIEDTIRHRVKEAQINDSWINAVRKIIENCSYENFYLKNYILYKDPDWELIVIPTAMEHEIISITHREGHFGTKKTKNLVATDFYIPNIDSKIS